MKAKTGPLQAWEQGKVRENIGGLTAPTSINSSLGLSTWDLSISSL